MAIGELTLEQRYPDVFRQSAAKRFLPALVVAGVVLYLIYAVWFFNLPTAIASAHWERLGINPSQWISYDIQPTFRLDKAQIEPQYPRFSPLGNDPHPDWVRSDSTGKWTIDVDGPNRGVSFTKSAATIVK